MLFKSKPSPFLLSDKETTRQQLSMAPRQLALLVVLAAPAGGLNMLDGVKKLLLKRDSAFLYQEKALFMPGANARTEAAAKTACTSGDRGAILRAVFLPGCNSSFAQCCESSGNQQLSGPPGAGVLPATNQLAGERSEPKSCGPRLPTGTACRKPHRQRRRSIERRVLPNQRRVLHHRSSALPMGDVVTWTDTGRDGRNTYPNKHDQGTGHCTT